MSEYQVYLTKLINDHGLTDTLTIAEQLLDIYLPEPAWSGHSPAFLLGLSERTSSHLRLRKDFFNAIDVDLRVKLKYPAADFMTILLKLCQQKQLDISMILGCEWNQAPKDNYVLGILILLLCALGAQSELLPAVMETMTRMDMTDLKRDAESLMLLPKTISMNAFSKFKKDKTTQVKDGTVAGAKFGPNGHNFMMQLRAAGTVTQFAQTEIKNKRNARIAVKEAFADKLAKKQGELLGLSDQIKKTEEEMLADSDIEMFAIADIQDEDSEVYFEAPLQKGLNVNFVVDRAATAALIDKINAFPLDKLLKPAKIAVQNTKFAPKIAKEIDNYYERITYEARTNVDALQHQVASICAQYNLPAPQEPNISVILDPVELAQGEGRQNASQVTRNVNRSFVDPNNINNNRSVNVSRAQAPFKPTLSEPPSNDSSGRNYASLPHIDVQATTQEISALKTEIDMLNEARQKDSIENQQIVLQVIDKHEKLEAERQAFEEKRRLDEEKLKKEKQDIADAKMAMAKEATRIEREKVRLLEQQQALEELGRGSRRTRNKDSERESNKDSKKSSKKSSTKWIRDVTGDERAYYETVADFKNLGRYMPKTTAEQDARISQTKNEINEMLTNMKPSNNTTPTYGHSVAESFGKYTPPPRVTTPIQSPKIYNSNVVQQRGKLTSPIPKGNLSPMKIETLSLSPNSQAKGYKN